MNKVFKIFIKKFFALYKEDAELIFVIFGIKFKFKYPAINKLEDVCSIQNLNELLEKGTKFPHPVGIVINKNAKIGRNCTIWQNVTIGDGCSKKNGGKCPIIGDNVQICAGSIIIGDITIGHNAIIGAGSVVVKDVPPNATVVGSSAKVIKINDTRTR